MKVLKKWIVISCLSIVSSAYGGECEVDIPELRVFFSNGMFNAIRDTQLSKDALKSKLTGKLPGYQVSYDIAYNHNENPMTQVLEVARNKVVDDFSVILEWISGIKLAPDWFSDALKDVVEHNRSIEYVIDSDVQLHVDKYRQNIGMCRKVLVVAHSQGNFYANQAWNIIYGQQTEGIDHNRLKLMGLLSVATPANQVGYELAYPGEKEEITRYQTLSNDWVINGVRVFSPLTLSSHITNNNDSSDWKNHNFIESYLKGDESGPGIVKLVKEIAYSLETLRFVREPVSSSAIATIGYDSTTSLLEIEFLQSGSVYRYYDVPQDIYESIMSASSIGRYYNQAIRGRYPVKRLL